jgi:hypothetical protein
MPKTDEPRVEEKHPIEWPKERPRTLIDKRRDARQWKKPFAYYRDKLCEQLRKVGAKNIVITYNTGDDARRDPSVAVYFSKESTDQDYSWQSGLGIDNPVPTIKEIDDAYRDKARKVHPEGPTPDVEAFVRLGQHRVNAKRWIANTMDQMPSLTLPCDTFTEVRWNVAALAFGIAALRRLEDYGLPNLMERAFQGFRTQIEDQTNGKSEAIRQ